MYTIHNMYLSFELIKIKISKQRCLTISKIAKYPILCLFV